MDNVMEQANWIPHADIQDITDCVCAVFDGEGNYVSVSKGWERLSGPKDKVIGKSYAHMYSNSPLSKTLQSHEPQFGYFRYPGSKRGGSFNAYIPIVVNDKIESVILFSVLGAMPAANGAVMIPLANKPRYTLDSILGQSRASQLLRERILRYAKVNSFALIEGAQGTGKELVAQALHSESGRTGAFVAVNCASIPDNLFESELFGYVEGSFTGARRGGSKGKFEVAQDGTLFLDEIHHLSLPMQAKLLRVLQERQVTRVGDHTPIDVNARVICSTNQPLKKLVEEGKFREDLYYRLNVLRIQLPTLNERREDIPVLAHHFVEACSLLYRDEPLELDESAIRLLCALSWPGNIRELQNVLERVVVLNLDRTEPLTSKNVKECLEDDTVSEVKQENPFRKELTFLQLKEAYLAAERAMLTDALEQCGGNKTAAAKQLNISRTLLYNKLKQYELE